MNTIDLIIEKRVRRVTLYLAILLYCLSSAGCKNETDEMDRFSIGRRDNIMRPENFGLANGRITTGINCNDLFSIEGIWAPPYVASDFSFRVHLNGQPVEDPEYTWRPFDIERAKDVTAGLFAKTTTLLIPGKRSFIVLLRLKNHDLKDVRIQLEIFLKSTLDRMMSDSDWGFTAPHSTSSVIIKKYDKNTVTLSAGDNAVAVAVDKKIMWDSGHNCFMGDRVIAAGSAEEIHLAFSIGPEAESLAECRQLSGSFGAEYDRAHEIYGKKVKEIYEKLPVFSSDNPSLVKFYDRSLVPLLLNRWEVPEFKLSPFYATGSIRGGCVGDYLWNIGESAELLSFYDPAAIKAHILRFLRTGVKQGYGFCPVNGSMLHPEYFYPVNQEKIIGLTYHYVRNTGDIEFLKEKIGNGTVIDTIVSEALFLDNLSDPVTLIDYNICDPQHKGGQSHLELRTPVGKLNYTNIMPDLNGRRYRNYVLAAQLSELAGVRRTDLISRAEELKALLKRQLWDSGKKWFAFRIPDSVPPISEYRYTVQMFYLLGSGVLDDEEETGVLSHLNDNEFLSMYGMHSLAKQDPAYFQPDVDNGGPGSCTSFPLNIALALYRTGKPEAAENIIKRLLWWGEKMPYWGDSFYADTMRYREETPLQCTIDAVAGAQCIIFGMFGISPDFDGSVRITPVMPSFAKRMSLTGVHLRGKTFDVDVNGGGYTVRWNKKRINARPGQTVTLTDQ